MFPANQRNKSEQFLESVRLLHLDIIPRKAISQSSTMDSIIVIPQTFVIKTTHTGGLYSSGLAELVAKCPRIDAVRNKRNPVTKERRNDPTANFFQSFIFDYP